MKIYAIILASGTGSRFGLDLPKQFYKLKNKTIFEYSVETFENHPKIDGIIIVSNPDYIDLTKKIIMKNHYKKEIKILKGGKTRQESSFIGISAIKEDNAKILIHDAVRPFIDSETISKCIYALKTNDAINVGIESSDTIVEVNNENFIVNVPERKNIVRCQTPQCFSLEIIKKAHILAKKDKYNKSTDDCSLILKYNLAKIFVIKGSNLNIKITYPFDIKIAEEIIKIKK